MTLSLKPYLEEKLLWFTNDEFKEYIIFETERKIEIITTITKRRVRGIMFLSEIGITSSFNFANM